MAGSGVLPAEELVPELVAELQVRDAAVLRDATGAVAEYADVEADVVDIAGRPERVLTGESRGAALLVVGSHGRGYFAGMVMGSVSSHVLREAHCLVAVLP